MRKILFLIFTAVTALLISHTMHAQTPDFKEPDFAFPQTVEADAQALLKTASAMKGNEAAATRLRAVLEICAARTAIDRNANFTQPAMIAAQAEASEGIGKAMLLTLEASKYAQIYSENSWVYDRVDAPLEPFPADVSEWSGAQFKAKIAKLLDLAIKTADEAPSTPLTVFAASLEYSPEALDYLPAVADFVRYKAYDILDNTLYNHKEGLAIAEAAKAKAAPASAPFFFWATTCLNDNQDELLTLYNEYADVEAARFVLQRWLNISCSYFGRNETDIIKKRDVLIALLRTSLERFPSWYGNATFQNTLARITNPSIKYIAPSYVAPGSEIKFKCEYSFVRSLEAALFAVPDDTDTDYFDAVELELTNKIGSASCTVEGTEGTADLTLTAPSEGKYALVVTYNGQPVNKDELVPVVTVTPLIGFAINGCKDNVVAVTDFTTGMPLPNVTVNSGTRYSRNKTSTFLGRTGKDGFILDYKAPVKGTPGFYTFTYGGKTYNFNINRVGYRDNESNTPFTQVRLMTDRPLYRPGDTVRWSVVAVRSEMKKNAVPQTMAGMKLTVEIKNTNGQLVDSATVTTDRYGRANGSFVTKEGALTGSYTFRIKEIPSFYGSVMVSDFKLPSFEAKIDRIERDVPSPGSVRVVGSARTFTGMAVAGAKVKLTLTGAYRWRWFTPNEELATFDTVTTGDGTFTFDIPESAFESEENTYTSFILDAVVTSQAAETAEATRNFTTGKPYTLSMSRTPETADTSRPIQALFEAYNADNEPVNIAVKWSLGMRAGETLDNIAASGEATTGVPVDINIDINAVGAYAFRIEPVDTVLADAVMASDITLYNISRNLVPDTGSTLFIPFDSYKTDTSKAEITVGTAGKDKSCVFIGVRSDRNLLEFRKEILKPGFHKVKIGVPDSCENVNVILVTVRNGRVSDRLINISRTAEAPVKLVAESFRDRLTPGIGESWRFRLAQGNAALDAAMVATLYNRALDKISRGSWPESFYFPKSGGWFDLNCPGESGRLWNYSDVITRIEEKYISWPQFRFFNPYMLFRNEVSLAYGSSYQSTMKRTMVGSAAAPEKLRLAVTDDAEYEMAEDAVAEAGNGGAAENEPSYRVAELLQVLWEPSLVADSDGNIDLIFTMPDAIGSWQFKAFAWSPEAKAAAYAAECMSSKPVMVQANLPRFLRQGDKARVLATVYNNSDEAAVVATTIELFDIATGAVVKTAAVTDSIAAGASSLAAIDIDVPTDASAIGYRVRAVGGGFSDGEQSAIPVLASSATVVESTQFYLNPKETEAFSLTLPPAGDATVTLQYCQNPIWTVVKAMRGLSEPGNMSTGIVGSLFSALAGKHIVEHDPSIAAAIAEWKANPSEEALVSMLAKNEELKKLLLDQTPWVQASQSQTARMSSLSDLLDPESTAKAIEKRTAELLRLQNRDGGFSWASWSEASSIWATETVLTTLAIANSLGLLPADSELKGMAEAAFDFLQTEAVKPKRPDTDRTLTLIKALMPSLKVKPATEKILRATVADIVANWRRDGTVGKAYDIIILNANGRPALASQLLASVRQHGVVQPGKGLCYPNVDDIRGYATIIQAYALMGAPAEEIDAMRQWITVYAQANDDLGAYNPDYIIASVLLTGSDWTSVPVAENITVDGRTLEIDKVESATGYFSRTVATDGSRPTVIAVKPNGVTPSYGSVVSVGRRPMSSIASKAGDDVSIEKRVLVQRGGEWVETTVFALGERVRVQLIIKATRDIQYVSIDDERPAAFEPVDQLPGYVYDGSVGFYRENGNAATRLFISRLYKGTYHISYDMTAAVAGSFISGIATLQSQYAPEITAHSAAAAITVDSAAE